MSSILASLQRLQATAEGLPGLLESAQLIFDDLLTEIHTHQDPDSPMFAAFMMAGASAADGRDAILFAPSLPWPPLHPQPAGPQPDPANDLVGSDPSELAALCLFLAARLSHAAPVAADPGDRDACRDAARSARDIHDLLAGPRP
ncbi:MAG: hypothetical protein ACRDNZ_23255 [Streptosporangiaceae bacterium]